MIERLDDKRWLSGYGVNSKNGLNGWQRIAMDVDFQVAGADCKGWLTAWKSWEELAVWTSKIFWFVVAEDYRGGGR